MNITRKSGARSHAGETPAWERAPRQNSAAAIEADRRLDDWVRSTAYRERNHR